MGDPRHSAEWQRVRAKVRAQSVICGICGDPLTDARYPHPLSTTVDHIVPLALGGEPYALSNLRAAHWRCNARKGKRVAPRGPRYDGGQASRVW